MRLDRSTPTLAILIPCLNEEEMISTTIESLSKILDQLIKQSSISTESFLFFIDDGSTDNTWEKIQTAACLQPKIIHGLKLSRNFGHQNALFSGLLSIKDKCDISISIDADLQQDPYAIVEFINQYKIGAEIVFGIRSNRTSDSFLKKHTAQFFYKFIIFCGVKIIPNHADYRLLSNKAVSTLAQYSEPNLFLRAICNNLGYKTAKVTFNVSPRAIGESKYSLNKMLSLASQGILSFSIAPLRFIALLGVCIFALSLLMSSYILIQSLVVGGTVPGWASTVLPIYLIGGLQILCLGIIGEYLGKIYTTTQKRPNFIIEEEI